MYCLNENQDANQHFAFFFQFFIFSFFVPPLFVHFSFSPMEISVTDFSAPIGASVLKFSVQL